MLWLDTVDLQVLLLLTYFLNALVLRLLYRTQIENWKEYDF